MRALVTGAGGQLGRALRAAAPAGVEAVGRDRVGLDIGDPAAVAAALDEVRPDAIINAAAYTAVDMAESNVADAERINADAPALLGREAAVRGIRLVHVSTDFVFDGARSSPYPPDAPVAPTGVYGASKLAGEQKLLAANPHALTVRTSWVYAATGKNFLVTMLRVMKERGHVRVVADQIGTPTHAAGLARALWAMAATDAEGVVHYADAGAASWYVFAVAIAEEGAAAGLLPTSVTVEPITTAEYPTPARRPFYSVLDRASGWALSGQARHWRVELREAIAQISAPPL